MRLFEIVHLDKAQLFWPVVVVLLCAMGAVEFVSARGESQIYDESNQLLSGYVYLTSGHFTVALDQPPLVKLLWAAPVALLRPDPPTNEIPPENPWPAGQTFLYRNHVPADTMLMAGRSGALVISVLLGLAIAYWSKRHFGAGVALAAVFVYAADSNFLAHGRCMKNDVAAVLMIFSAVMIWGVYLARPRCMLLWASGIALGLALATKDSALILPPVMFVLYVVRDWLQGRRFSILTCARRFAIVCLTAYLVIFTVYGFEVQPAGASGILRRLLPNLGVAAGVPVPALSYFRGLADIGLKETETGRASGYVLGEPARFSRWYMSPVALAVKTPLGELALFALAAAIAIRRLGRPRLRAIDFKWFLFAIPPVMYFVVSMLSHLNAGIRHLLPLYPFLVILATSIILGRPAPRWRSGAVLACGALLLVESAAIYPHYLAFFNALAGGPTAGRRFLVDSNLDWGQDVKYLREYLDAQGIRQVCISYFGMADLAYYGVRSSGLPELPDFRAAQNLDCVAAISVTNLALQHSQYGGLEAFQPDARIGYSIYVYNFPKRRAVGSW